MQNFRSLLVWQKAHTLALDIHRAMAAAGKSTFTGTRAQLLRAASSVPTNIVEGCGKGTQREFARFLDIAHGSAQELEYHLLVARELGMIDATAHESFESRTVEVRRMLFGLARRIRQRQALLQVQSVKESVLSEGPPYPYH